MSPVLYLVVELRGDRYAIPGVRVIEVVPLLRVKSMPGAPPGFVGLANYRGDAVPVVDLHLLAFGSPTPVVQSARIVIVTLPGDTGLAGTMRAIGLLVPRAHSTIRLDAAAFLPPPVALDGARYLGPIFTDSAGVIQQVTVDALLTPELRAAFDRAMATGAQTISA